MANVRNDRRTTRWPRGEVPFVIDGPLSNAGRQNIRAAMAMWTSATPVTFVERRDEEDYVKFNLANDACFSNVGRLGGEQRIGCDFPIEPVFVLGSPLRFERQADVQVTSVFAGSTGALHVMWTVAPLTWASPVQLTGPNVVPAGAPVALHHQGSPNQLDALFVDTNGVVNVMWVNGLDAWQGPVGLTPANAAQPGAPIALHHQVDQNQLDALFVDTRGAINVMWVIGGDIWQGPVALTAPNVAPPGAPIALSHQVDQNQLDVVFVDVNGAINVMWVTGGGAWQGPVALTAPNTAPPGAPVALHHQVNEGQLDVVFVDVSGAVNVMWVIGGGAWQGPVALTAPNTAPPGAPVTLCNQGGPDQLDALFIDTAGAINVMWVVGGGVWNGPVRLTPVASAFPGSEVGVADHQGGTLEAVVIAAGNVPSSIFVQGLQNWSALSAIGSGFGVVAIAHELGHALGLFHEHARQDRNAFVTFNPGNVIPANLSDFQIPPKSQPLGRYDYASLMHYGPGAFSAPGAGPTLQPPPAPPGVVIVFGNAVAPSATDAQAVSYIYGRVAAAGSPLSALHQASSEQLSVVFADAFGGVSVMWVTGRGVWEVPVQIAMPSNLIPPGGNVRLHHQGGIDQLDALFVDGIGAINVMWVNGLNAWQGPVGLTAPNIAPPGAPIALHHQIDQNQLDAVFVDVNGAINVMWVVGGGAWQGPVALTPPNVAPPGAQIALHHQVNQNQLDALFVDVNGAVNVMWVLGAGAWQGPVALTPPKAAPPGAQIALHHQVNENQLTAVFSDAAGAVSVMWVIGGEAWQGPVRVSVPNTAPPGALVSLAHQNGPQQLDAVFVDVAGAVNVMWVADGGVWQGPVSLTAPGSAVPGSTVALHHQAGDDQLDALYVDRNGSVNVLWVQGMDAWSGPATIS